MDRKEAIAKYEALVHEISKVIIEGEESIQKIIMTLLADGHVLLEGVPGLAKTLTVMALGRAITARYKRIQMVPDLLPSDILGTYMYVSGSFELQKGPLHDTHIALCDEVNRAPTKTQAALLEAMQERQITVMARETFPLPDPFMVLATMNPIEQEGTYNLPEAQIDRFLLKVPINYISLAGERGLIDNIELDKRDKISSISPQIHVEEIVDMREDIKRKVKVSPNARDFMVDLVRASRQRKWSGENVIKLGASPRAILALRDLSRVRAYLDNRNHVIPEDVLFFFPDVMRHRIMLEFRAKARKWTAEKIIQKIIEQIQPA